MLPIVGIYEVAIKVKDLARAEKFYCETLDLEVGIFDKERNWLFLRAGGDSGILVLQEEKGDFPLQHLAFTVEESEIQHSAEILRGRGVKVSEMIFHGWIPAKSIYFDDPDGNNLEFCAIEKILIKAR